jgi:arylsulfatase A-like enzyme
VDTLFQTLTAAGEMEQTVFFFISDNGLLWGEHRLRAKAYPYEEAIRVPFLVRQGWADSAPQSDALVLNIDLVPTILDYAEAPMPTFIDGRSLRPLLANEPVTWREDFLVEAWGERRKDLPAYSAVRGLDYLYVVYADETREYYDLAADPYQMENVVESPDYVDQVLAAQERLDVLLEMEEPE